MSIPPSPHSAQPSRESTPSPKDTPGAGPGASSHQAGSAPVCAYHQLRLLQASDQEELPSNSSPNQHDTSPHPNQTANPQFEITEFTSEEIATISKEGIELSWRHLLNLGFQFPESHPFIPMIKQTVDNRAATWRAEVQLQFPNLEECYLDKIESDTKVGNVYLFLALYLSSREPGSGFDVHEANPAA